MQKYNARNWIEWIRNERAMSHPKHMLFTDNWSQHAINSYAIAYSKFNGFVCIEEHILSFVLSFCQSHLRTNGQCWRQNETNSTRVINQYAHGLTYDRFVYFADDDDNVDVRAICSMISPQTKIINNLNYFTVSSGDFTLCTRIHSFARPPAQSISLHTKIEKKTENTQTVVRRGDRKPLSDWNRNLFLFFSLPATKMRFDCYR